MNKSKKYELTNETIELYGRTLHRIKALKDFNDVKKGDIGGYIEKEDNLSQYGNCWVYDNACVYDNAKVFGCAFVRSNAKVFGCARICECAKVYDYAEVYEYAKVYGRAMVYGNAEVFGNAYVYGNAKVYECAEVYKGNIIGKVSIPYKDIFQYQCENRMLTAILTEDDEILYSIGCQNNITKDYFIWRIYNIDGGLEENPHRQEYLDIINRY